MLLLEAQLILVGLLLQGLAWTMPLRKQTSPKNLKWDITAMVLGSLCAALYGFSIGGPLSAWAGGNSAIAQWQAWMGRWPVAIALLLHLTMADFLAYWAHRALHSSLLWHSHAWHHSPKHVWWLSGLRASPLHIAVLSFPFTVSLIVLPVNIGGLALTAVILFGIANQHWLHTNLEVPCPKLLEMAFVTPRFHFVHHSADKRFTNSNYGFIFSVWDRLFGTYTDPESIPKEEPLGLDYTNSNLRLLLGLPPLADTSAHQAKQWSGTLEGAGAHGPRATNLATYKHSDTDGES